MADHDDEELRMAIRMSMQTPPPEPKRSKPRDAAEALLDSPEEDSRQLQRELLAAAAEKRLLAAGGSSPPAKPVEKSLGKALAGDREERDSGAKEATLVLGRGLSYEEAKDLFSMIFGSAVSKDIVAQWSNQGIRFSPDPETSVGLVQHEGGPCGVLATIQAFVLKYLLFFSDELNGIEPNMPNLGSGRSNRSRYVAPNNFVSLTEEAKARALVRSMREILFLCGSNRRVVIASLDTASIGCAAIEGPTLDGTIAKALDGLTIESTSDFQKILRIEAYTSQAISLRRLQELIPVYQSRMGVLLFLVSALLSRGLDNVQADRDDPSLPLVTAPFGHASQEIVNLLLCGQAVPNVFDGRMDLGGGMCLKGISTNVQVGFLTLLESLNFCNVGQNLKRPQWPIWVVGSESHYTVLFALDTSVQDENELELKEFQIRKSFDAQDQSGGGGFISVQGFQQVLRDTNIRLPAEKYNHMISTGFIVWSEFWQVVCNLDKDLGGLRDSSGSMGKKVFELYHFNGIAKSDLNGHMNSGGVIPIQRPRLTKLRVSVPPKWTPEEFMANVAVNESSEVAKPEPSQHAPLVDCIRTRWARAVCNWVGEPPSIV